MFTVVDVRRGRWWVPLLLMGIGILGLSYLEPAARRVSALFVARLVPIYKVDTPRPRMAISFDATWGVDQTDRLLEILERNDIKTTFFLAGYWVEKHPEYVRKISMAGHEVANHSYAHPHMNRLSSEQIVADLQRNHDLLVRLTGKEVDLFRPPFGEYSDKVIQAARSLGYHTIQWSIDSLDWKDIAAGAMVERVLSRAGPGEIVLFHNAGKHTPEAIERLLPALKSRGIEVVPVGSLIHRGPYEVEEHSGVQRRKETPPLLDPPESSVQGNEGR